MSPAPANPWPLRWQRFSAACVRAFHVYAIWLIGISWRRFIVLSILLMIGSGVLQTIPPFSWTYTTTVTLPDELAGLPDEPTEPPQAPVPSAKGPGIHIETPPKGDKAGVDISIDERGVRITPRAKPASAAVTTASAAGQPVATPPAPAANEPVIDIRLPPGTSQSVRQAVDEARKAIEEAAHEARADAQAARAEAEAARSEGRQMAQQAQQAQQASRDSAKAVSQARKAQQRREVHRVSIGEFLPSLALLWIIASLVIKISYKRQVQALAQAAQAVQTAESESLKRQVVEARMAAMQAQVEPHFLFNTLASIDHLIEVDPQRASQMQKNLIALLRASMPTMREANDGGAGLGKTRDLGRELAVIRPYLEILKVRMEERLATEIDVPEGLLSAEFPPMMVQTLVENAIKHGLEPKPEGGKLSLKAEIVHGKLSVTVADTGLGFGRAATSGKIAGTGVGLINIRERLQLLYGPKASLTITENPGGGTRVTLAVPYKPIEGAA